MTKDKTYAELSQELDTILTELQSDDFDIDKAITLYERGIEIAEQLEKQLKTAQNKVTKLKQSFDS